MKNVKVKHPHTLKSLAEIFLVFLKLGAFTFGGGYAMISLLREAVVEKKKWLSDDEMVEVIGIAESTPGPIAINMATFVGYKQAGVLGSTVATVGVVLPSLIIIYAISLFFEQFLENQFVKYAFYGIKIAVSILILNAAIEMIKKMERKVLPIFILVAVTILMLLIELFNLPFSTIYLILIGGIIGIISYGLSLKKARKKS